MGSKSGTGYLTIGIANLFISVSSQNYSFLSINLLIN